MCMGYVLCVYLKRQTAMDRDRIGRRLKKIDPEGMGIFKGSSTSSNLTEINAIKA